MEKFSFDELKSMADEVVSSELLEQISGGTENDCHDLPDNNGDCCTNNTCCCNGGGMQ